MFKWEVLEELTVEEWAKFKEFVKTRPIVMETLADGRKVESYLENDLHEFMVANNLIKEDISAAAKTAEEAPKQVGERLELDFKEAKADAGVPTKPTNSPA